MKFTYYTIIGKDVSLLKSHIENIKGYAGYDKLTCEKELLVIVYTNSRIKPETTAGILEYCKQNNIRTHIYNEPTTNFLDNLYACWNLGYEHSTDGLVFRGGSDQVFSRDSFPALYEAALAMKGQKVVLQANTIENPVKLAQIGAISRHFAVGLGCNFGEFNYPEFERFISVINREVREKVVNIQQALQYWRRPTKLETSLGNIDRVDGCSWLMTKEEWVKYGPLPPLENSITGDVIIHDRMQRDGYTELIVRDCVTYHFVQGER
jgi:hypothetical protein